MRRYLAVIGRDLSAPFRWTLRGVGAFFGVVAIGACAGLAAVFVVGAPWYALLRFIFDYPPERAGELTVAWLVVTWAAIAYAVSVHDRATKD